LLTVLKETVYPTTVGNFIEITCPFIYIPAGDCNNIYDDIVAQESAVVSFGSLSLEVGPSSTAATIFPAFGDATVAFTFSLPLNSIPTGETMSLVEANLQLSQFIELGRCDRRN
jgi:hypothetical protein